MCGYIYSRVTGKEENSFCGKDSSFYAFLEAHCVPTLSFMDARRCNAFCSCPRMQKLCTHYSFFAGFHLIFACLWLSPNVRVTYGEMIQVHAGIACLWALGLRLCPLWAKGKKLCPTWEKAERSYEAADGRMGLSPFLMCCLCRQETAVWIDTPQLVYVVLGSIESAGVGLWSALCICFCVELHKIFKVLALLKKKKNLSWKSSIFSH